GLGSPILDLLVEVEEEILNELELNKGEMVLTSAEKAQTIINSLTDHNIQISAGGSCANTIYGVGHLGGKSAFCGVIGNDENGKRYALSEMHETITLFLTKSVTQTGRGITLPTKDGQ